MDRSESTPKTALKTAIIGQGCIATALAYYVNDPTLHFVTRNKQNDQTKITYRGHAYDVPGKISSVNSMRFDDIDVLLVPIKSYHNDAFISEYTGVLPASVTIVVLQNGIQFIEQFIHAFPNNPIIAGLTTDGVFRDDTGMVTLAGKGKLVLGSIQGARKCQVAQLLQRHPNASWTDDIFSAIFKKLLVNIAINPLTFIQQCRNGELLKQMGSVQQIIDEVFTIFDAIDVRHDKTSWCKQVVDVINGTAQNQSSMLQDRLNKRPTEIDAILGTLLIQAKSINQAVSSDTAPSKNAASHINTPHLITLYQQIKAIEQDYLSAQ